MYIYMEMSQTPCVTILNKQEFLFFSLTNMGEQESRTDPGAEGWY
jgi:hypothetical protein